jgi:predicted lactoylglutathione lyase
LNLPVKDVAKSRNFFKALGFKPNPMHEGNPNAASFFIGEHDFVLMLFPQDVFKGFIRQEITDTKKSNEVLINIDAQSREEVDRMAATVRKAGGKVFAEPGESQGWLYAFGFEDPDGHRWNMLYMDMSKNPAVK